MRCVTSIAATAFAALLMTLCPDVALGQGHIVVEQDVIYGEASMKAADASHRLMHSADRGHMRIKDEVIAEARRAFPAVPGVTFQPVLNQLDLLGFGPSFGSTGG